MVKCECGFVSKTKYCGDCGAQINGDSPLNELITYLRNRWEYWDKKPETPGMSDKAKMKQAKQIVLWEQRIEAAETAREARK